MLKKRIFALLFAIIMLFSFSLSVLAESPSYEDICKWALDVGLPQEFIDFASYDDLLELYLANRNLDVEFEAGVGHITSSSNSRTIPEDELEFWMVAGKVNVSDVIQEVNVYVYYEWLFAGKIFTRDGITMNWDEDLWVYEPYSFSATNSGTTSTHLAESEQGGIGWTFDISPFDELPQGNASFTLTPVDTQLPSGTRYRSIINAEYGYGGSNAISLEVYGVGVTFAHCEDSAAASSIVTYGT